MACASRSGNFVKLNLFRGGRRKTCRPAFDIFTIFTMSFELRAVDRSVFDQLSPGHAPPAPQSCITSSPPSPPSKPPPSSRLLVFFFASCLLRISPSTCLFRLACCWHRLLYRCCTSSRHITGKRLLVGGGGAPGHPTLLASERPPHTPSPPSPTSLPSFSVRLLGCSCSFSSQRMLRLLLLAC